MHCHSSCIHVISKSIKRLNTITQLLEAENYRVTRSDNINKKTQQDIHQSQAVIIDCIENFGLLRKLRTINKEGNNILAIIKTTYSNKKYIYSMGAFDYISSPPTTEELLLRLQSCKNIGGYGQATIPHTEKSSYPATLPVNPHSNTEPANKQKAEPEQNKKTQLVTSACRHLTETISRKHTLNSLARTTGTNRNTLCTAFKEVHGQSVFSWLRGQRMHMAAKLLRETSTSIQQICFEVGYHDPANFSTAFKKHFGTSPRKYRKK
jgi:AraC-like DNA-binding protein